MPLAGGAAAAAAAASTQRRLSCQRPRAAARSVHLGLGPSPTRATTADGGTATAPGAASSLPEDSRQPGSSARRDDDSDSHGQGGRRTGQHARGIDLPKLQDTSKPQQRFDMQAKMARQVTPSAAGTYLPNERLCEVLRAACNQILACT